MAFRTFALTLLFGVAALAAGPVSAQESYPSKPIKLVVPFTAGGFTDNTARLVAQGISDRWKISVVVDNKPGGGGNVAGGFVANSPADGYTLFLATTGTHAINPAIYDKVGYNPFTDHVPVIALIKTPNLLSVANEVPAHTLQELVALAKAKPGALNLGSPGNGTTGHFSGALFNTVAGIKLTHVPYRGTPQVLADMLSGAIQVTFDNVTTWAPQAKAGKVRAIAVTSLKRSPLLPEVPTIAESGYPGFEATSWLGITAPKGTPAEIIDKLNKAIQEVLESEEFKSKIVGAEVIGGSPQAFTAFIDDERQKWAKVAKEVGLKVD